MFAVRINKFLFTQAQDVTKKRDMQYRKIGKTNMSAGIIGLGAEHLDGKPYAVVEETIHAALAHDINIMDVFMLGADIRQKIGKALGKRRKDFILQGHIGSVDLILEEFQRHKKCWIFALNITLLQRAKLLISIMLIQLLNV